PPPLGQFLVGYFTHELDNYVRLPFLQIELLELLALRSCCHTRSNSLLLHDTPEPERNLSEPAWRVELTETFFNVLLLADWANGGYLAPSLSLFIIWESTCTTWTSVASFVDFITQVRGAGEFHGRQVMAKDAVLSRIAKGLGAYMEGFDGSTSSETIVLTIRLKYEWQAAESLGKFPHTRWIIGSYPRAQSCVPESMDILNRNPSLFWLPRDSRLQLTVRSNMTGEGSSDSVPMLPFNKQHLNTSKFKANRLLVSDPQSKIQIASPISPLEVSQSAMQLWVFPVGIIPRSSEPCLLGAMVLTKKYLVRGDPLAKSKFFENVDNKRFDNAFRKITTQRDRQPGPPAKDALGAVSYLTPGQVDPGYQFLQVFTMNLPQEQEQPETNDSRDAGATTTDEIHGKDDRPIREP
ncbi:uncharacterized protein BO96DRAFT_332534, partial [Aspergillus niger CBS 101883]|uniref:uncharacterized protein n=1 Tax=Aspergillus lacticoffeatus (strain CBS 101883) TaxID=1450533 RepID=UPI000D7EE2DD